MITTAQQALAIFTKIRRRTEALCSGLAVEDYVVQSMPDVSPTKWHIGHTTWFWEQFLLTCHAEGYTNFHPWYPFIFNSYYITKGDRHCRQNRGQLSRPTVQEIYDYRHHVDQKMTEWLSNMPQDVFEKLRPLIELGLNHEEQHQELLLMDIKHVFWVNPMRPAYQPVRPAILSEASPLTWTTFQAGMQTIGHNGEGFAFDNEGPAHLVYLNAFKLANRATTNAEYQAFMKDGGYKRPELWLSPGWATVQAEEWHAPLYWLPEGDGWVHHTLSGVQPIDPSAPVCHVSLFEADAYARWAEARLPLEEEWEVAAQKVRVTGNFMESGRLQPEANTGREPLSQLFGDVWEWTGSQYRPYPGFRPLAGAAGEYNGKFMVDQFVLRGGAAITPRQHIRTTYRNFFPSDTRWQFSGIRLAKDV